MKRKFEVKLIVELRTELFDVETVSDMKKLIKDAVDEYSDDGCTIISVVELHKETTQKCIKP